MKKHTVAILGAGSWGTAVAMHLAKGGYRVLLWAHDATHVEAMQRERCNSRYLPNLPFPSSLILTSSLEDCQREATETIIAVPSHAFPTLLHQLKKPNDGIAWLTKGVDPTTNQFLSQLVVEQWGDDCPIAIISGPSFALEVARGLPTALVIAGHDHAYIQKLQSLFHHDTLRAYLSTDIIGVQLSGAVKNVLAIACGMSDGLKYGANAKAALITRGLAEMQRLGVRLGALPETFMGLAGLGDLVLTCTDDQSRNRRFGLQLGQGVSPEDAQKHIGQVVEGMHNAAQICALARQHHIDMPICQEVDAVLHHNITARNAADQLLKRPPRDLCQ